MRNTKVKPLIGYTDKYSNNEDGCEKITLVSFDGDRYVKVIRENGEIDEIKTGYIYKNHIITLNIHL